MTSRPFDFEGNLSRHGNALRQLAAELLRDRTAAEDAVQEVWLRAVRRPPQHEAAIGGWLVTLLRNVTSKLRRGEQRRVRRERLVAREEGVEDHSVVAAREELLHRLVAEVSALETPFREAIWRRYFEGLAPREIAANSGVPIATVKSRLQRGLQQLREKLGEDGESDWRGALALAFGMKEGAVPAGAAGTTATAWSGVLLMTAWTKSLAAVAVVAVASVLFWSLHEPNVAPPSAGVVAEVTDAAAAASGTAANAAKKEEVVASSGAESNVTRVVATPRPRNATFRGRCVDESGAPLAECDVVLRGWAAESQQKADWLADHAGEWKQQVAKTAADGTFAFEFLPPPPFQFALDVMRNDRIPLAGGWPTIAEGERIDLGDVVLAAAARVVGRVVDEAGSPVTKTQVTLEATVALEQPGKARQMAPSPQRVASTNMSGAFTFRCGLPFGSYRVQVQDRRLAQPQQVDLVRERPQSDVTIVVVGTIDLPTITGRVVDEADKPVGAWIHATVTRGARPTTARTGSDGRFEVRRPDGEPSEAATISVVAEGFESPAPSKPVPWGTRDLEFRVVRARGLSLRVVDANEAPILDYRVRLLPQGGVGWPMGDDLKERARGPFVDGTAMITGIKSGKWLAIVDFPPEAPFLKKVETIDLIEGGPTLFTLRAETGARRLLRVVDAEGKPMAGTRVQLCDLAGRTFSDQTQVFGERMWLFNQWNPNTVRVQFEGTTDADGTVMLVGQGGRDLGMRILGPGHVPLELLGVRLEVASELVAKVNVGARLVGTITPPEAMIELRRLAQLGPQEPFPSKRRPIVHLSGTDGRRLPSPMRLNEDDGEKPFEIADDGSFDVTGLPPGTWQVRVAYKIVQGKGSASDGCTVATLDLVEGQTKRLEVDLRSILPGILEGEVTRNSLFHTNAQITLERVEEGRGVVYTSLETDAQGRFTFRGRPGLYALRDATHVRAEASAEVFTGETTRHSFRIAAGTLQLRVLDAAGKPAIGVQIAGPADDWRMPPTTADGATSAEKEPQTAALRVLPKRLLDREAMAKAWQEGVAAGLADPLAPHWIAVGTATITAGQTTTLELRLPPEWEK